MYRCFACDTPAQMNCACYTQMEHPELNETGKLRKAEDDHDGAVITVDGVSFPGPPKINISSGEDAIPLYAEVYA